MEKKTENAIRTNWLQARAERVSLVEHRMESLALIKGVEYINDSKATDLRSVAESLTEIEKPITLILQVSDMPEDFSLISKSVRYKVVSLFVFGEGNEESVRGALSGLVDRYAYVSSLEDAVQLSGKSALKGEVVLFSPGCASFGMFDDYRHRGESFRTLVNGLK